MYADMDAARHSARNSVDKVGCCVLTVHTFYVYIYKTLSQLMVAVLNDIDSFEEFRLLNDTERESI